MSECYYSSERSIYLLGLHSTIVRSPRALGQLGVVGSLLVGMRIQRRVGMDLASGEGSIPHIILVEVLVMACDCIASLWPVPQHISEVGLPI